MRILLCGVENFMKRSKDYAFFVFLLLQVELIAHIIHHHSSDIENPCLRSTSLVLELKLVGHVCKTFEPLCS